MASFPSCSLLLSLVITLLIQPALSTDPRTQELIDEVCRECEDYGFCNITFNENLKTPTTNVEGLAQITIEQALYNATDTYIFVKKLLSNTSDETVRNYLTVCDYSYYAVMNLFQEAFRSFDQKNYRGMVLYECQTTGAVARCDGIFYAQFVHVKLRPLVDRNKQMRMLITMALVTSFMLVT